MNANYENGVMKSLENLIFYVNDMNRKQKIEIFSAMLQYALNQKDPEECHLWSGEQWNQEMIDQMDSIPVKYENNKRYLGNQKGHVMNYMKHMNGTLSENFWYKAHEKIGFYLGKAIIESFNGSKRKEALKQLPDTAINKLYCFYK